MLSFMKIFKKGFTPLEKPVRGKNSLKGFTLSELLMAMAILASALCAIVALFVNCSLLNVTSRNLSIAASHANFVMEAVKNTPFADIKTSVDAGTWTWANPEAINANGLSALRNESITTTAAGTSPLEVDVRIAWRNRPGRNQTFLIGSLFQ